MAYGVMVLGSCIKIQCNVIIAFLYTSIVYLTFQFQPGKAARILKKGREKEKNARVIYAYEYLQFHDMVHRDPPIIPPYRL